MNWWKYKDASVGDKVFIFVNKKKILGEIMKIRNGFFYILYGPNERRRRIWRHFKDVWFWGRDNGD